MACRAFVMALTMALVGCGDDGGGGVGATGEQTTQVQTTADTVVFDVGQGDGPAPSGMHGVVLIELRPAANLAEDPFVGTASMIASLRYSECLIDFYASTPSWRQDGVDGLPVFDDYTLSLCGMGTAACAGVEIAQNLDVAGSSSMAVTYGVGANLEGQTVAFGPLPTEELAGCPPVVNMNGVTGFDAMSTMIWRSQSFDPAAAETDQNLPITVRVAP